MKNNLLSIIIIIFTVLLFLNSYVGKDDSGGGGLSADQLQVGAANDNAAPYVAYDYLGFRFARME